ncbi:PDZ domain-containing protein [Bacillus alkalisoli]|uniref:PDZ domain-containing protein n=1 Tax=Bacillus alkalisoli TaxID=2011008 RepID=UPI0018E26D09|nr:PDZ domain-containing protein [Bacillus alkalisoli]
MKLIHIYIINDGLAVVGLFEVLSMELLKAIGRFFIHPVTYTTLVVALFLGYFRVKRERYDFHTRVFDVIQELRFSSRGILYGFAISIITVGLGLMLPFGTIVLITIITILFMLTMKPRWLSAGYILGLSLLLVFVLPKMTTGILVLDELFLSIGTTNITTLAIVLAMLLFAEGLLISKQASMQTSPQLWKSKRGLPVGAHDSKRIWLVPVFLFLPGEGFSATVEWWPVFHVGGEAFTLWLVPFAIGFSQHVRTSFPDQTIRFTGRKVMLFAVIVTGLAIGSYWWAIVAVIAGFFAFIGREAISYAARATDEKDSPIFVHRKEGLIVLGIIPGTPAASTNVKVGEIILKVNGMSVSSVGDFYEALHKNRAFCKLQVVDENGESRFVQRALYEGEHHELGFLFVQEGRKWDKEKIV